ncbi:MAG: hypothetical protein GTN93_28480, partial [Anaerolineae bacterium]|nr:hypothetical protein [Anaerolineae bacterium]NIQ81944.1 hypothetical protein [Anaerolineae bacterium]
PTSTPGEGQLCILDAAYVYTPDGCWDRRYTMRFWQERLEIAGRKYNGLRAFGDCSRLVRGRVARLKLLEYEALVNLGCAANIALCGYGSSGATRSFLQQAKSVHPFIASSRSVQRNHLFVETSKFLGGLYRFRRVSRVYPADASRAREARKDLEEIAARTPLAIPEIEEMKVAMSE